MVHQPALSVDPRDPTPLYAQLDRAIRAAVATGRLLVGTQLPTVRQLAVDLRINANTVAKVYAELERAGVVETRRGVGTFVIARGPESTTLRERERALRSIEDRFLAEAASLGFDVNDVIQSLEKKRKHERR